jgi:hypothetical protein
MNESRLLKGIRRAYACGPPAGVDQIWYADTAIPSEIEFNGGVYVPNEHV